jgi:hypothetical protein
MVAKMSRIENYDINSIPINSKNGFASSSKIIFNARKRFNQNTLNAVLGNISKNAPIANLLGQESFYGTIDKEGDYIVYNAGDQALKKINGKSRQEAVYVQDFVADAFTDLKKYINNAVTSGGFKQNSFYANISAKSGFRSIYDLYDGNYISIFTVFLQKTQQDKILNSKIKTHKDFIVEYRKFLEEKINLVPHTFSETVAFYNLTFFCSGMMISLSDDDAGDDLKKFTDYMYAEDYGVFLEFCKRFGFKVDKNVPWVLVADIASPAMKKYLNRYGIRDADDLLAKRFVKAYKFDFIALKNSFFDCYNQFVDLNISYDRDPRSLCFNENNRQSYIVREKTSRDTFFRDLNDPFWIKMYVYLKNLETKRGLTQQQYENVVREANDAIINNYEENALKFINGIFRGYGSINNADSLQTFASMIDIENPPVGMIPPNKIIF